jgi:hypothetical protein
MKNIAHGPAPDQDDPIVRAADLYWIILHRHAHGEIAARDAAKAELIAIATEVGPEFWDRLVDRESARFAKLLELPPDRYHEAERAIVHDLKKHFGREIFLAVFEPEGHA